MCRLVGCRSCAPSTATAEPGSVCSELLDWQDGLEQQQVPHIEDGHGGAAGVVGWVGRQTKADDDVQAGLAWHPQKSASASKPAAIKVPPWPR